MESTAQRAIAIVGAGAILPDAKNVPAFWENVKAGRYSISEVTKDRWDPALYYDADHSVPDKTYSKIGGWVREYDWEPVKWHLPVPPRVVEAMDDAQKWAIACTREALEDYGYPHRPLNPDRTAVILGNAMAGEKHYLTALRVFFPEYAGELEASPSFAALPDSLRREITRELRERMAKHLPQITEDSMPGELSNCLAGRIANLFNFHGPNFVVDAACASAVAALNAAAEGLIENDFDVAVTGGIDRNMGAPTFVKFCKIGALSATGTRPYAEGADGFVMGEGGVIFLLKRLADAEREGDKIYAVLRGIGGSSDGKGKGITAPNPIGQKFCIERAWQNADLSPASATYIEGHGTSTRVGDVVEVQSMADVLSSYHLPAHAVAMGSVKSNIGHLKGAAGAAGILKTALALRDKILPPSVHCERPNPDIDFAHSPLYVNTSLKPWNTPAEGVRRAGVSAFGFGGTNFHAVLEEYIPHRLAENGKRSIGVSVTPVSEKSGVDLVAANALTASPSAVACKAPLRGALLIGAATVAELTERLRPVQAEAQAGRAPAPAAPQETDLRAPERIAIDYEGPKDLAEKCGKALQAFGANQPAAWKVLRAQGIFRGRGPASKVAFLYTGQGSQYVNMLAVLRAAEPIVADAFAEADHVMTPLLGKPLSEFIFVNHGDEKAVAKAEEDLRQTAITQPAVLATDLALTRLLAAYGITPDMTMGHSLGEYGALVASGALPFANALEAVSARGREMTRVSVKDNGKMAAVFAPIAKIEELLKTINGYVVIANLNSDKQAVIGGASEAVEEASHVLLKAGYNVVPLPVSHAFHTSIVAPASGPLRQTLERLHLQSPRVPIVANVNGEFYPTGADVVPQMLDILAKQVASPVQFVKGLQTLHEAGARVFVEVGPKKALQGFVDDVLGDRSEVISLFTNHPKLGDVAAFNQALCGLYAAGLGRGIPKASNQVVTQVQPILSQEQSVAPVARKGLAGGAPMPPTVQISNDRYMELGRLFADTLARGWQIFQGQDARPSSSPVVITGAALGLPGTERIFDDGNIARILHGNQFIGPIPSDLRQAMVEKHITRLVKSENGGPTFETIRDVAEVIKLAGRGGAFDLEEEFGVSAERIAALDRVTRLAMAAGIDAMRDAGIPLVMRYKTTSKGTQLPDRWGLPESLRDDTGVIFASAFPGYDSFADEMSRYFADYARREQLSALESLLEETAGSNGHSAAGQNIQQRIQKLRASLEKEPYVLDRRFLFRILSMGHSQFAEFIGARGPNTQVNAACASTTQAVALAEDWIRSGRCRRVIVVSADDVTSDHLMEWIGAGFLASGAAATDEAVEEAATPFDRRRHGMIVGMGAAALIIESAEAAQERGIRPICEVLSTVTANSAFHGTRLDIQHISQLMETLIRKAEANSGISRQDIAGRTVFVSHETYTPARGGSASAEIFALRQAFGEAADRIVIANTKGFTGHAMGTGIEDVVAVKALETGYVPPVANFKEVDPELGALNLSKGGSYPVEYALRLGAGFGSQISLTLLHWLGTDGSARPRPEALGYATRIADRTAWNAWLSGIAGRHGVELEVVHHTLRVPDRTGVSLPSEAAQKPSPAMAATPPVASPSPAPSAASTAKAVAAAAAAAFAQPVFAKVTPLAPEPNANVTAPEVRTAEGKIDSIKERILALIAEKTGYPTDMLDLDLDLEADLGVDTVKQAEVFAAIRELYNIPRDENRKLRDYPTLSHVIRFVQEKRPDLASIAPVTAPAAPAKEQSKPAVAASVSAPAAETGDAVKERILALVVEKTGYPKDMLDLDLDLEADLGVDTVKQAEMFAAIREIYDIPRDENRKLRDYPTLSHVIRFVLEKRPDLAIPAPAESALEAKPDSKPTTVPAAPVEFPTSADDAIKAKVLEIVAEKTGYPIDMLDLDLDLEADLGIDTVKQAEMFASVRAAFSIPRDENLKLRDFPTLARVIQFAKERQPSAAAATTASSAEAQKKEEVFPEAARVEATTQAAVRTVAAKPKPMPLDAANAIPRRVPVATLRPPLRLCKQTGVTLEPNCRVVLMPDKGGATIALAERLKAKGVEVLPLETSWDAGTIVARLQEWLNQGPIQGVYWLPALDAEGDINAMDLPAWREALRVRVKSLYSTMRALYEQIVVPGTFLVSGTRLGGQHGYDDAGAASPLGGAVTGFTKAYKRERGDALVKVVDFAGDAKVPEIADLLIEETLQDPGAVEIGYKEGLRWTVGLEERRAADGQLGMQIDEHSVFLITGAAGGIVSAITADLAAASGGTFYLLDLIPEPKPEDPDLKRFVTDKDGLKRDLFARIQARGERATPALVEKELAALERQLAASNAIAAVKAAGGKVRYFCVNLTDAESVKRVIEEVHRQSGHIDVLLHAAGLERSHFLRDKEPGEFNLIFDVKSDGWFNLLRSIGGMPLSATVAFSSIAGRFGNGGQTDYSAANDLLCKLASNFRSTRPATRAIAIDWTAWGGIGMATRGSIPKMMELAGIDMLPPEAGIPLIRRELTTGQTRGEVVIAQRLGILLNEFDATGGLDPERAKASLTQAESAGPILGAIQSMNIQQGLTMETMLDPKAQPFLHDHRIDGTPVLPGVMGIEAFAEATSQLLPGWRIVAIEDVNFLAPFKFYRNEPRALTIQAAIHPELEELVADCKLLGTRTLPGKTEAQTTTHFSAKVRFSQQLPKGQNPQTPGAPAGAAITAADIYRLYFHGPAYQVLEQAWRDGNCLVGQLAANLPANHAPAGKPTLMEPRLIELCFQTAGLWEMSVLGRFGLPHYIQRVALLRTPQLGAGSLFAIVSPNANGESFDAKVVDIQGTEYLQLIGYRTVALPNRVEAESLKALQDIAV